MSITFTAVGPIDSWYGVITNTFTDGKFVTIAAAPVVAMTGTVAGGAGFVPASGSARVGIMFNPIVRLVVFPSSGAIPDGVHPLPDAFPTGPGFTLLWPEGNTLTVTSSSGPLPQKWDADGDPVADPR